MTNATAEKGKERPYKPSWIDRFNGWLEKLPVRVWVLHAAFGTVLIMVQVLLLWLDGGLHAEELLPVIIFNGLATPFTLALVHLLDNQAVTALYSMRPSLEMNKPRFDQFQYKLSNMPSRAALIAGLIVFASAILMERLWIAPVRFAALEQYPTFTIVFHILDKSSAFMLGVLVYHTVRQLRLVNIIHFGYTRVSLFNLGPLRAFSKLTASTAVGLVFGVYGWMLINPELLADPISLGFVGAFTVTAVAVFVWPLAGVHRLMQREKEKALREIDVRFEAVFSEFNRVVYDDDFAAAERLSGPITSLEIQYKRISVIPTWPWRPETARIALTAIALPLILTILQYFVLQTLDR
jgi:hypothetical protein